MLPNAEPRSKRSAPPSIMPARTRSGPATPTARTQRSDASPPLPVVTRAEVARHSTEGDLWVIVNDGVYDMTRFLRHHPGGPAPLRYAGADATAIFTKVHKVRTVVTMYLSRLSSDF